MQRDHTAFYQSHLKKKIKGLLYPHIPELYTDTTDGGDNEVGKKNTTLNIRR